MFTLIHSADWHCDPEKYEDVKTATDAIIKSLQEKKPNAHVIAGDIWNKRQVLNQDSAVKQARDAFIACANEAPTILIKGNNHHDNDGSLEVFRNLDTKFPTFVTETIDSIILTKRIMTDELSFVPATAQYDGLYDPQAIFHLLSYPEKGWFLKDKEGLSTDETNSLILDELKKIFIGFAAINTGLNIPKILVFHGNVAGSKLSNGQLLFGQEVFIPKEFIELAQCDYVAGGHIHKSQEYYSGSIFHVNHGETEKKQINYVEIDNGKTTMQPIYLPSIPLSQHNALYDQVSGEIFDADGQGELFDTEPDWIGAKLRVRISLTAEQSLVVSDEMIQAKYPGAFEYKIERIIETTDEVRSEAIITATKLRDKVEIWGEAKSVETNEEILLLADEVEQAVVTEG
jgi:DNA repair exonuclease SbcCD nuclease subunit